MVEVKVNPGVCGLKSLIKVNSENKQTALIEFQTACPNLKPLEQELKEVDGFKECFAKLGESQVYELGKKYCKHPACPVPSAIIKGVEVACGLALPRDVEIKIEKL